MKCPLCYSDTEPSMSKMFYNCPEHGEMSIQFIVSIQSMDQFKKLLAYEEYKKTGSFVNGQVLDTNPALPTINIDGYDDGFIVSAKNI